ncbi:MAG: sensor histidine kinase, partial [Chloroflexota bacterium]
MALKSLRAAQKSSFVAQEEERQWIAFEVHDRVAQTLASVFQQLQTLESITSLEPQTRHVVVRARMLVREAIRDARNIMNELHPPLLDDFGVVPLIEEEIRHFREDTGCQVRFDTDYPARPPAHVELALYRVFHEALNNVRRHAPGARNVGVTLTHGDGVVTLGVQDDGSGFDVKAATASERVGGLMSMRRRTEVIGGTFTLVSRPGTLVTMRVPLNGVGHKKEEDGR